MFKGPSVDLTALEDSTKIWTQVLNMSIKYEQGKEIVFITYTFSAVQQDHLHVWYIWHSFYKIIKLCLGELHDEVAIHRKLVNEKRL